ncbi:MAG: tRNA (adenosine(37)-N6)-threonylcarbamoyltransferase complex transferase subunit TsaD [Patescibacteria group bacterium]
MKILAIETSCDDTGIALLDAKASGIKVIADTIISQTKIHEQYGGVFPVKAKMAHAANLVPALLKVITPLTPLILRGEEMHKSKIAKIKKILEREMGLFEAMEKNLFGVKPPKIDRIAVTYGPGLEPALWVGISFAKALSILWGIPVVPVNHMRGHFLAPMAEGKKIIFPALGLLISGGHTELILAKSAVSFKLLGTTRDDACGEAYDKVARILGLPYPGGPHIARMAEVARRSGRDTSAYVLPRPMLHSKDLAFSFAGLKTAVLYMAKRIGTLNEEIKENVAKEFEEAVKDVLVMKTKKALSHMSDMWEVKSLVVGGGVSANVYIMQNLEALAKESGVKFLGSSRALATDNAVMIGVAGYFTKAKSLGSIKANGNLPIEK